MTEAGEPSRASPGPSADRVAVMSFHSHGDRSFLDDRDLALLSGDLRAEGMENDLVVVVLPGGDDEADAERALARTLAPYDIVVYERIWSTRIIDRLRTRLPGRTFVHCRGEHRLDDPPADFLCQADMRRTAPALLAWLRGKKAAPPSGVLARSEEGGFAPIPGAEPVVDAPPRRFAPNLRPVVVNPDQLPRFRTFALHGNGGCPYQEDARENPLYAGTRIPDGVGRGCAFCTTGNQFDGRPAGEVADTVLEQIAYLRENAPHLDHLVLKDQNPFVYLASLLERCAKEGIGGFTLMLETRADWMLKGARRFEAALTVARSAGIRICPYLVGIENFSQDELDRYNKGIRAETNVAFLEALWRWKARFDDALDLDDASFGFVLFSPWTTLDDLRRNLDAIRRTRFHELRGNVLLSRARLYPDTALYYLAERDGLLIASFRDGSDDNSRRYGYYPSHPWRFADPRTGHLAALATELVPATGGRDQMALFACLLEAFEAAGDAWPSVEAEAVLAAYEAGTRGGPRKGGDPREAPAADLSELRRRLDQLVHPLDLEAGFSEGWRLSGLSAVPGRVSLTLSHPEEPALSFDLVPRGSGDAFRRSRHYDLRYAHRQLTDSQTRAAASLAEAICRNDR
jgi:hypothetical protein